MYPSGKQKLSFPQFDELQYIQNKLEMLSVHFHCRYHTVCKSKLRRRYTWYGDI